MIFRFSYELAVGIISILAVIIFGDKGQAALVLLVPLPIILRMIKFKPDERELQLFYKSGNLTVALIVALMFTLGFMGLEEFFIRHWIYVTASAFLIAHGAAGLLVFSLN